MFGQRRFVEVVYCASYRNVDMLLPVNKETKFAGLLIFYLSVFCRISFTQYNQQNTKLAKPPVSFTIQFQFPCAQRDIFKLYKIRGAH